MFVCQGCLKMCSWCTSQPWEFLKRSYEILRYHVHASQHHMVWVHNERVWPQHLAAKWKAEARIIREIAILQIQFVHTKNLASAITSILTVPSRPVARISRFSTCLVFLFLQALWLWLVLVGWFMLGLYKRRRLLQTTLSNNMLLRLRTMKLEVSSYVSSKAFFASSSHWLILLLRGLQCWRLCWWLSNIGIRNRPEANEGACWTSEICHWTCGLLSHIK